MTSQPVLHSPGPPLPFGPPPIYPPLRHLESLVHPDVTAGRDVHRPLELGGPVGVPGAGGPPRLACCEVSDVPRVTCPEVLRPPGLCRASSGFPHGDRGPCARETGPQGPEVQPSPVLGQPRAPGSRQGIAFPAGSSAAAPSPQSLTTGLRHPLRPEIPWDGSEFWCPGPRSPRSPAQPSPSLPCEGAAAQGCHGDPGLGRVPAALLRSAEAPSPWGPSWKDLQRTRPFLSRPGGRRAPAAGWKESAISLKRDPLAVDTGPLSAGPS